MRFIRKLVTLDNFLLLQKKNLHWLAICFFILVTAIYFKPLVNGLVPVPFDIVTGTYFPWLDYKWGYAVGVPVKNASLTDVVATLYPWRSLAMDLFRNGQFPLWNPYAFSGMPLLANWQSAVLYPLNILMLLFGNLAGWTLIILLQPFLSMFFMYLFLRGINCDCLAAIFGGVIFALSGFMMTYLEYATGAQAFMWLPLMLWLIEKYLQSKQWKFLLFLPLVIFFVLTAGFFQPAFYALLISFLYLLFRAFYPSPRKYQKRTGQIVLVSGFILLGISLASLQLFPTFELIFHSIRQLDHNITEYHYGLLPLENLLTFIAPDFFGNPVTGNFWGFMGYQETTGYFGVISLVFVILSLKNWRKNRLILFFGLLFIISVLFAFNPLGKIIYLLKVPFISTGYASRLLFVTCFASAALGAFGLNEWLKNRDVKRTFLIRTAIYLMLGLMGVLGGMLISMRIDPNQPTLVPLFADFKVAFKNSFLPIGLLGTFALIMQIIKSKQIVGIVALILVTADLLRFGIKFNPFVPAKLDFPNTPILTFLQQNVGNYRIERERTETLPANYWIPYHLQSPSGYDPLVYLPYAQFFNVYNLNSPQANFSRYEELENYDSKILNLAGVKYLLVLKRDDKGVIDPSSNLISYKINQNRFTQVFTDKTTVVLQNQNVLPRVMLYDNSLTEPNNLQALELLRNGLDFKNTLIVSEPISFPSSTVISTKQAKIIDYQVNQVEIEVNTDQPQLLLLTDTNYPGWQVYINNQPTKMLTGDGIYRAVVVPAGNSVVKFIYQPTAVTFGLLCSLVSLLIILILSVGVIFKSKLNQVYSRLKSS